MRRSIDYRTLIRAKGLKPPARIETRKADGDLHFVRDKDAPDGYRLVRYYEVDPMS